MSLTVNYDGETITLDNFYKSLMFQQIMDGDLLKNEKNVLLVILRQTLHYDKLYDNITTHQLCKKTSLNPRTLKDAIYSLESKGVLEVKHTNGGRGSIEERTNRYRLSRDLMVLVINKWLNAKGNNGFTY